MIMIEICFALLLPYFAEFFGLASINQRANTVLIMESCCKNKAGGGGYRM